MKNKVIAILLLLVLLLSTAAYADDCCCVCKTEETNGDTEAAAPAALIAQADPASENTEVKEAAEAVQIGQPEKTDFSLGYLNSTAHLLGFVAREEGYFQEEGLNVDLIQFSSAAELSTGLESGKLDVAFIGSVPTLTFQSKGHDLTVFGGAMTNGHGYVIKPEYTEGLESWDISILKGRNVASVKNSVQDAELQILLKNADIEIGEGEDKVNIIYFDSQKDAFAALQNGSIDAASVYSPYASLAEGLDYKIVYRCSEEEALKNQPCCRQVASTEALQQYPNAYIAFERALLKAYKFTQENEEQTIKDVKKYIDIDEDYIRTEVYGGYGTSNPDPDKQGIVALKQTIVELGYTEDSDDPVYLSQKEHFDQYE